MQNNNGSFQWEKKKFKWYVYVLIALALTLLDTVTGVALVIGAIAFYFGGHRGLAWALVAVNLVAPDMLPFVDEIFGIIAVAVPTLITWHKTKNLRKTAETARQSRNQYESGKSGIAEQNPFNNNGNT